MANSKKRISELPALSVASLDTTFVLGISGSTTYKISINNLTSSLDGAFATDLVTNALSSSLNSKLSTSSFNSYTASAINGTISGSSQLTSSFDQRYTLSGSIPNIPTGSFATTGSNTFNGDMTLISSSNIILRAPGADGPNGAGDIVWQNANGGELARLWNASDSNRLTVSFTGSHNSYVFGTLIHSLNLKEFGDDHFILTSSFNSYTASQSTSSLVNRLNAIESVSGSWITESETGSFLTSLSGAISSSTQISDLGFVTGSYTTINSFNSLTQSFNSISQSFNVISGSVGTVDFNGIVSGSSQLTSSYDTRYTLSGSVQPLPSNLLSSSAQITAFGFISSSQTIDSGSLVTTSSFNSYTASLNAFSSSLSVTANSSTKILDAYYTSAAAWSGSYSGNGGTVKVEANFALYSTSIGTKTFTLFRNGIAVDSGSFYFNNTGVHTTMPTLYYIGTNETGTNTYSVGHNAVSDGGDSCNIVVTETFNTLNAGLISGSSQLTSSFDIRYVASGSISAVPAGTISGSSQLTSSFDLRYLVTGSVTSSINALNTFTASQSTASLVTSITNLNTYTSSMNTWTSSLSAIGTLNVDFINAGRITSDQTGLGASSDIIFNAWVYKNGVSLDTTTGVFTLTAGKTYKLFAELSFSIFSSVVGYMIYNWVDATTNTRLDTSGISAGVGEAINRDTNEFNATSTTLIYTPTTNQTIKVRITEAVGTVTVRSAIGTKAIIEQINPSVALNQFETLQVSGSLVVSGSTTLKGAVNVGTGSGYEGGEILLAYAQGGSTSLTGSSLVVDVYADKLRIFESDGNSRGVYLDLTKQAAGVGSEILTKASGLVNRGVDVTLGNLKARIAATGNISLQLSTVSGTYSVYGSSVYSQGGAAGTTIDGGSPRTISTTPAYLNSGYNFATAGATDTWNIMDTSNSIAWRITMILGAGVNNNLVSIERLH